MLITFYIDLDTNRDQIIALYDIISKSSALQIDFTCPRGMANEVKHFLAGLLPKTFQILEHSEESIVSKANAGKSVLVLEIGKQITVYEKNKVPEVHKPSRFDAYVQFIQDKISEVPKKRKETDKEEPEKDREIKKNKVDTETSLFEIEKFLKGNKDVLGYLVSTRLDPQALKTLRLVSKTCYTLFAPYLNVIPFKIIHLSNYNNEIISTFVITKNGRLFGIGDNTFGQLGLGKKIENTDGKAIEIKIKDKKIKQIIATRGANTKSFYTIAVTDDGEIYIAGTNTTDGMLGLGKSTCIKSFEQIKIPGQVDKVKIINNRVYCLMKNGELYLWGNNYEGALGVGEKNNVCTPKKLNITVPIFDVFSKTTFKDNTIVISAQNGIWYCKGAGRKITNANNFPYHILELNGTKVKYLTKRGSCNGNNIILMLTSDGNLSQVDITTKTLNILASNLKEVIPTFDLVDPSNSFIKIKGFYCSNSNNYYFLYKDGTCSIATWDEMRGLHKLIKLEEPKAYSNIQKIVSTSSFTLFLKKDGTVWVRDERFLSDPTGKAQREIVAQIIPGLNDVKNILVFGYDIYFILANERVLKLSVGETVNLGTELEKMLNIEPIVLNMKPFVPSADQPTEISIHKTSNTVT